MFLGGKVIFFIEVEDDFKVFFLGFRFAERMRSRLASFGELTMGD